jgi:hypothetical protein
LDCGRRPLGLPLSETWIICKAQAGIVLLFLLAPFCMTLITISEPIR